MSAGIPLPVPTELSRPHWDGCREGVLRVQRCTARGGHVAFLDNGLRFLGTQPSWAERLTVNYLNALRALPRSRNALAALARAPAPPRAQE